MKKFEKRPRSEPAASTRTGPRARAAQERKFNTDPYSRAERPARPARPVGFDRGEAEGERRPAPRPAVITLDPDVARVFRDSETVNEALRIVMRLARFGGSRPPFNRDRPGMGAPRSGPPARGGPRGERPQERRGPPRPRTPRFEE